MMAMYDYARHLQRERLRGAEQARLVADVLAPRSRGRASAPAEAPDRWQVLWGANDVTGRAVTMVNSATGEKHTGRDPGDWDRALGEAVRQLEVGV